jgi:vesicle coat complex subunit
MADNQNHGEIISNETAENEFGSVTNSVSILSELLQSLSENTKDLMMFNIQNNQLYILGDNRKILYPSNAQFSTDSVFKVYSKTKVLELLNQGQNKYTTIENRNETITITNGNITLEYGTFCPPWCSD